MKVGCEEVRIVDLKRELDEDVLVAETGFLETIKHISAIILANA